MNESFIHYLWQHQYFNHQDIKTIEGEPVYIFHPGNYNRNAGPDFLESKIKIGEIEWVGSVEIHIKSSDFNNHQHQFDHAYNNVVLHVVWQHDKMVQRADGTIMPTIELRQRVDPHLIKEYRKLVDSSFKIPCSTSFSRIKPLTIISMIEKAAVQRLHAKAQIIQQQYKKNTGDWEETFYQVLAKNFGFKVNAEAFETLSKNLPLKILRKNGNELIKIESLLMGMAGFLECREDCVYHQKLQNEFNHLARKFDLNTKIMAKSQWKFLRLRPANFPTTRLAQFASVLSHSPAIFEKVVQSTDLKSIRDMFSSEPSSYWANHYSFGKMTRKNHGKIGEDSVDNVIINSVVPTLVAYAQEKGDEIYFDRALEFLQQVKPESNSIINTWGNLGVSAKSAFDSQGLIEQMNQFCKKRNCLNCTVGNTLLRPT